jgi:hypothetical protein
MATYRKPGERERESTIALTGDDLETVPPEQILRAQQAAAHRPSARPPRPSEADDPSMRELTVPLYDSPTLEVPTVGQARPPSPFAAPPAQKGGRRNAFPSSPSSPMHGEEPVVHGPILTSHIEAPPPSRNSGTFMPISTFPPATVKSPASERSLGETVQGRNDRVVEARSLSAPAWVIGYLLLCAALTLIGLVVLYFEHRMLGNASPL